MGLPSGTSTSLPPFRTVLGLFFNFIHLAFFIYSFYFGGFFLLISYFAALLSSNTHFRSVSTLATSCELVIVLLFGSKDSVISVAILLLLCELFGVSVSCSVVSDSATLWTVHSPPGSTSPPGSSAHGILQARILEWVAVSSSRGPS